MSEAEVLASYLNGSIVLMNRDNCTFSTKVKNAQTLGAIGVIIGNGKDDENQYVSMLGEGNTSTIDITSIFILYDDFQYLYDLLYNSPENIIYAMIDSDGLFQDTYFFQDIVIFGSVFCLFFFFGKKKKKKKKLF
ncbi:protease domain-containing protein [Reticulomyxa filosa]|uniref:Protease domain-containing protein n=1 Tax=Reticulomyxa filosa TaxID=46433 RepID=X6LRN3_RETFI|nr:protease domain-containing protein [Reticulomyxa filosa]|eukprot:ETO04071.1 protease domain-containing protein [Reticulomyxa filosa]